jgi:cupin superfamily acireductone dioxygenase involved in methionine salvage
MHDGVTKRDAALAKEEANRDSQLIAMLQKAQVRISKLIDVNAKEELRDHMKLLEADLHAVVSERGYQMPATTFVSRQSPEKKSLIARSKRSRPNSVLE